MTAAALGWEVRVWGQRKPSAPGQWVSLRALAESGCAGDSDKPTVSMTSVGTVQGGLLCGVRWNHVAFSTLFCSSSITVFVMTPGH